jgi:hypothetical protein
MLDPNGKLYFIVGEQQILLPVWKSSALLRVFMASRAIVIET